MNFKKIGLGGLYSNGIYPPHHHQQQQQQQSCVTYRLRPGSRGTGIARGFPCRQRSWAQTSWSPFARSMFRALRRRSSTSFTVTL